MALQISGKNMDIGDSLRETADYRLSEAVSKYFDGGYEGRLTIEHEGGGFRSDCTIHLDSGVILQAGALAENAIASFEQTATRIEKRLRRYKRKLKNHRPQISKIDAQMHTYILQAPQEDTEVAEDFSPAIIAETSKNFPTLSVGDAVMTLDLTDSNVLVFRHAGHNGINVVYRRTDGNIGWVDPQLHTPSAITSAS